MKQIVKGFVFLTCIFFATPKIYAQIEAGVDISVGIAPPELPEYEQPECPGEGYIWTPGYWGYGNNDYYFVPGVWVIAPQVGYLWTPSYWDNNGGRYGFHAGYWGPHIGFYGGINYGFGYGGHGYDGGRWEGNRFRYNTAVSRVNIRIVHNTYIDRSVTIIGNRNRVSFHGQGGINESPRDNERQAMTERHLQATSRQVARHQQAANNRNQYAAVNHGKPQVVVNNRAGSSRQGQNANARPAQPRTQQANRPQQVQRPANVARQQQRVQPQRVQPQRVQPQRIQRPRTQPARQQPAQNRKPAEKPQP